MRYRRGASPARQSAAAAVAAAAALCLAAVLTAAAAADEPDPGFMGIRLVDAPVARRDDPRALTYIVDHLPPGTTIRRHVEVSNKSAGTRSFQLYPAAASITQNRFTFADGHGRNELTEWIRIAPARLTLSPSGKAQAEVTITIPGTAKQGERYAVVWAESAAPPDAAHNIGTVNRVGVRVYLDVGSGGEYTDFTVQQLLAVRNRNGRPGIVATVRNTGKRALDLKGRLRLSDGPGGLSAGPFPVAPGTTLPPGGTGTVTVPLDPRLPEGPWTAVLELASGQVNREVRARLTFPAPGAASRAQFLAGPRLRKWYAGGLVLIALGAVLMMGRRRRRAARR